MSSLSPNQSILRRRAVVDVVMRLLSYGFVTFDEEKHVKKLLNLLDKEQFKFQDKVLNIQQAFYTARRRPYGSHYRDKSRGYRPRMANGKLDVMTRWPVALVGGL